MKRKTVAGIMMAAFWWGLVADILEGVRMLSGKLFIRTTGLKLIPDTGLSAGLLYGVPVMFGWTLILFWASRKPFERRGVLLCLAPVILGYIGIEVYWTATGVLGFLSVLPVFLIQAVYVTLTVIGYIHSGKPEKSD